MPKLTIVTQMVESYDAKIIFCVGSSVPEILKNCGFKGKLLEASPVICCEDTANIYIGTGEENNTGLIENSTQMELFAKAAQICKEYSFKNILIDAEALANKKYPNAAKNAVLGFNLGLYNYKNEDNDDEYTAYIPAFAGCSETAFEHGRILAQAVIEARRLSDCPANELRPVNFARHLTNWLTPLGIECHTINADELTHMGMNGLFNIGASAGKGAEPCLFVIRYKSDKSLTPTALVGKGVTFDSGGTCLKSAGGMGGAKGDMAGGAAVAGAIYAIAATKCPANIVGIIPMCENRLSPSSLVPGDVYTSYSGKTVEVLNTDAEGRLILADAVSYAVKNEGCERIIDIATLTGAVVNALGFTIAGAVTNNEDLWNSFNNAAKQVGEQYWLFPSYKEHREMLKSDFADIKNVGEKFCGTITGGMFIGEFAENMPWLHLDIAGAASVSKPFKAYQSKGATGVGVLALHQFIANEGENAK